LTLVLIVFDLVFDLDCPGLVNIKQQHKQQLCAFSVLSRIGDVQCLEIIVVMGSLHYKKYCCLKYAGECIQTEILNKRLLSTSFANCSYTLATTLTVTTTTTTTTTTVIIIIIITTTLSTMLKVKYCPRVAAVDSVGSNKVAPSSE